MVPVAVFVLVYCAFLSMQRVMFVRNLLLLLPAFATWAAWGAGALADRWYPRVARFLIPLAVGTLLLANGAKVRQEALRLADPAPTAGVRAAHAAILAHSATQFYVTPTVREAMTRLGLGIPDNLTGDPTTATTAVFWLSEIPMNAVPGNRPGTFTLGLTAPQVNLDYYPTWVDRERVVAVARGTLRLAEDGSLSEDRSRSR